ncbi:MAG TPA: hypothetical protein VGJ81_05365 [Thermoanaerobaculia bacterium]|jgi:hypothetical protein
MFTIERWKLTRHWALYENGNLIRVTVYKRGAVSLRRRLEAPNAPSSAVARDLTRTNALRAL